MGSYIFKAVVVALLAFYIKAAYEFFLAVYRVCVGGENSFSFSAIWLLLDILFISYMKFRFEVMLPGTDHLPEPTTDDLEDFCRELINPLSIPDPDELFTDWFMGTPFKEVGKYDLISWICAMVYNRRIEDISPSQLNECVIFLSLLEEHFKRKIEDKPPCKKYSLTLDPVNMMHRPFIFYAFTNAISYGNRIYLSLKGFTRTDYGHLVSYVKKGTSEELPILFFHGMGVGLAPYIPFLNGMMKRFPDRTFLLMEHPAIAMRGKITHCLPETFADTINQVCADLKIEKVYAVAHSFGTISICWLDKFYPGLVERRIFIDPICFALLTIHTMRNFLYRLPVKPHHYVFTYLVAMEPGTQLYLRRYFVWSQNTYFSPDLPKNSTIYLPERDDIVNVPYVSNYLNNFKEKTREVIVMPRHKHMQKILGGKFHDIFDKIEEHSKKTN
jgi:pimeloyl-ACP methyl ester carboxylesterase